MTAINVGKLLGAEPMPQEVKDRAEVHIEGEDEDEFVAIVIWPDPTFHERYSICTLIDGAWHKIAAGWRGRFTRPAPVFLERPVPAAPWIVEKIEDHRASS